MQRREFLSLGGATLASATLAGCARRATEIPAAYAGIHDALATYVNPQTMPGAVWLLARGDDVVVDVIGTKSVGGAAPMQRDTIFRIASMTKAITSAAVLMLVEEGKVRLDETVDRLLPELSNRRVLRAMTSEIDDTVPASDHDQTAARLHFRFRHVYGRLLAHREGRRGASPHAGDADPDNAARAR